jgi:hypothetical protein
MNSNSQRPFGACLTDYIFVQVSDDIARARNVVEKFLRRSATLGFLIQDRLAQFNAFAANVYVTRSFDQWTYISVALATERAESILFCASWTTSSTA